MEFWRGDDRPHSGLMLAARITLPHLSASAFVWELNSEDVKKIGVLLISTSRALTLGLASPALISRLSLSMIAGGVPVGTPTPVQMFASYPETVSPMVGTSGSRGDRIFPATASARNAPELMCGSDVVKVSIATCTCPLSRSMSMG